MRTAINYQIKVKESAERFKEENPDFVYSKIEKSWYRFDGKYYVEATGEFNEITLRIWEEDELLYDCHLKNLKKMCIQKCAVKGEMNHDTEMLILTDNGVLDLEVLAGIDGVPPSDVVDRLLKPHDQYQDKYITMKAGANYLPDTPEPRKFLDFLNHLCNNDREMVEYILTLMAYCLSGKNSFHYFYLLHGLGRNGKSTFLAFLEELLGGYFCKMKAETFSTKGSKDKALKEVYRNRYKRLAVIDELPEEYQIDVALVKAVTGGDSLPPPYSTDGSKGFTPEFKIVINTNHLPDVGSNKNVGIWERLKVLITCPPLKPEDRIEEFHKILLAEKDAVLTYLINNYLIKALSGGLKRNPQRMLVALDYKRFQENPVEYFFGKILKVSKNPLNKNQWVGARFLHGEYTQFHLNAMDYFNRELALGSDDESRMLLVQKVTETAFSPIVEKRGGYKKEYNGREYWINLYFHLERVNSENGAKTAPEWVEKAQQNARTVSEQVYAAKRQIQEIPSPYIQAKVTADMINSLPERFEDPEPINGVNVSDEFWKSICDELNKILGINQ